MPRGTELSDAELVEDLQRVAEDLGHEPLSYEYETVGKYAASTFTKHFGSWSEALERIDVDRPNPDSRPSTQLERASPEDFGLPPIGER